MQYNIFFNIFFNMSMFIFFIAAICAFSEFVDDVLELNTKWATKAKKLAKVLFKYAIALFTLSMIIFIFDFVITKIFY